MHWQALSFIQSLTHLMPSLKTPGSILEIGAYCVNESIRQCFNSDRYVGVDVVAGPGVDVVCDGAEFVSNDKFDLSVSCECFEHNPRFLETFERMCEAVSVEGCVAFTAATTGRPEHGTTIADGVKSQSPGNLTVLGDYYRNVVAEDFPEELLNKHFRYWGFFENNSMNDLYFVGFKNDPPDDLKWHELENSINFRIDRLQQFEQLPVEERLANNGLQMLKELDYVVPPLFLSLVLETRSVPKSLAELFIKATNIDLASAYIPPFLLGNLARFIYATSGSTDALDFLAKVNERVRDSAQVNIWRGQWQIKEGLITEGLRSMLRACETSNAAWYHIATLESLHACGRSNEGLLLGKQYLEDFPKSGGMHFALGCIYQSLGDPRSAEIHYRYALTVSKPSPTFVFNKLIELATQAGDTSKAEYYKREADFFNNRTP